LWNITNGLLGTSAVRRRDFTDCHIRKIFRAGEGGVALEALNDILDFVHA
jgi:hypothetical protein